MRSDRDALGASGGLGFEAGPLQVGVEGELGLTVASGIGWEFPDAATAARFLAEAPHGFAGDLERWPPAWRSGEAGLATTGWAGLGVMARNGDGNGDGAGGPAAGVELSAESAAGARIGHGATTLYLRTETRGPRTTGLLAGLVDAGPAGPALVEYTRDRGGPRELAFRVAARGARSGQLVESVARLDLRDPVNRAVAGRLLRHRAPWPPSVLSDLRAVVRHTARVGTVERSVYAVTDESGELELAGRLGAELGLELDRTKVDRRLVEASAWTAGSAERAREDCTG